MNYNITYRKKDKGIQVIISYKDALGKWKQKSKQGFSTKREAKNFADKLLEDIKIKSEYDIYNGFENLTIGELKEEYLKHIYLHRTLNTYNNYKQSLSKFTFDSLEVSKVNLIDIQKCINKIIPYSSTNTLKRRITIFKCMMNFAKRQYNIPIKDFSNIDIPKDKSTNKRKALNSDQVKELLDFYNKKDSDYKIAVNLALNCGLRIGEIMGLTWDDINFKDNCISVTKQWQKKKDGSFGFTELKSKNSNRTVPLPVSIKNLLIKLHKVRPINIDKRLILANSSYSMRTNLDKQLRSKFDTCIHELRHTYATKLIANGLDFKTAAYILGHDVEQTIRTYSHVTDEMYNKAADLISNIF
ncbi:site-specific integrase [Clostridium baratii]|uniref:site-specific integrase n=1 Tax=Clostridium baratii TaxID=1561 RepID=UPI0030CA88E3